MARTVVFEVSREDVVEATREAIAQVRLKGLLVSRSLSQRLFHVARSAREFAISDWFIDGRCGCLIGNLIGHRDSAGHLSEAQYWIGMQFDYVLRRRISEASPRDRRRLERVAPSTARVAVVRDA